MAVAIGLGVYELATLGALALGAIFLASPAGQKATKQTADKIADALAKTEETNTEVLPVPISMCPPKIGTKCPPCPPAPPPRIDKVPPSRPHWPCTGDHMHFFEMNQNPVTCQCFPREKEVICL